MNQAFIDGQNIRINTKSHDWTIDLTKFRIYLKERYKVEKAYYFVGAYDDAHIKLYSRIQEAGYILVFREHSLKMTGKKKGNVDTDIVFSVMQKLVDREKFDKVILVSGDGDYFKMVNFLIERDKFGKLLAPNRKAMSSLYRPFCPKYTDYLDRPQIKNKIEDKKRFAK